jgi:phosphate transport system substrate-binding protein
MVSVAVVMPGCGAPLATPEAVYLQAAGSMAMGPLVDELAAAFHEREPWTRVDVLGLEPYGGLGTAYGLEVLRRGETDMALASWLPLEASGSRLLGRPFDPSWHTTAIARDGIAIIVHPDNPLGGLGLLQLRDIFSGRTDDWRALQVGAAENSLILPVSREAGSGTRAAFETMVMEGLSITPRALLAPSGKSVVEYVAQNVGAVGYVSMDEVRPSVKVLRVEGELPSAEAVSQGIYALSRELWLVMPAPPVAPVQDFVDFALSPAGQQIVAGHVGRIR